MTSSRPEPSKDPLILLERLQQAAEQYLTEEGDEARMRELRVRLGEASLDAALFLRPRREGAS